LKAGVAPIALGLSLFSVPALAQDAPQSADEAGPEQQIVVTGTRISNPNLTSVSPVTVVSAQEVKSQGTTRVEDLLNSLPQVFASEGSTDANGASGIATVDLRDLGAARTLVLINGRRLGAGDPTDVVADLNFIPGALIKRVDVLTGGASATYGSDALAGVVNFVLDTKFEGIRLDAQYSFYNHNNDYSESNYDASLAGRNYQPPRGNRADGGTKNVTLVMGAGFDDDRGHVSAYAGWRKVNAVTQGDRDFSYCGYSAGTSSGSDYYTCGGSSTSANGRFRRTKNVGLGSTAVYSPINKLPNNGPCPDPDANACRSFTLDPAASQTFRSYSSSRDGFNFNPYNYFQRPDERFTLGGFADYEINEHFKPYLEVMFMDDHTRAQIAPSGAFYGTDFFVNCNNALMSAAQQTELCGANAGTSTIQSVYIGRRNVEGAGRVDDLRHTDYRIVVGMKGDINDVFSYDMSGQYWRAILAERYENDFSRKKINNALNVVTDPSSGQAVCAAFLSGADTNCVPWNIWTPGGVTQAATNYLATPGFRSGQSTEYVASAVISGDLGKMGVQSPWADNGAQIAMGVEYRKEQVELTNDAEFLTGDLAGQGTPFGVRDVNGEYTVKEVFGELSLPLVSGRPGIETLGLSAGYRYSDYSLSGGSSAYKVELEYAPIRQVRFRAGYNRAVRSPNTLELFSQPNVTLFSRANGDPCGGASPSATLAECALTGVAGVDYGSIDNNPASQYNQQTSGNTSLRPETADTWTLGMVINPMRNLSISVDGYQIKIKDSIGTLGANFILDQCIATANPFYCGKINRSAGGSLWTGDAFVQNWTMNLGSTSTRGIDVTANYKVELGNESSLTFDLVGTYLDRFEVEPLSGALSVGKYDCAGLFGQSCGTPLPKWRHKLRATYSMSNGLSLSAAWRFFKGTENDGNDPNPLLHTGTGTHINPAVAKLPSVSYFDLSLSARVGDNYTLRVGAQNVFDKTPPVLDSNYSNNGSNVYAQVYDSLGRYVYAAIELNF
jgi:outer membrane receptor protein involved in Fe transport